MLLFYKQILQIQLLDHLYKFSDIDYSIFEERIMKGQIETIMQLNNEVNNFKKKMNQDEIDIYHHTRESLKYLKSFKKHLEN